MKRPYRASIAKIFILPRVKLVFEFGISMNDLLINLGNLKNNHNRLVNRILIDGVNQKFWIDAGLSKNATTFKGIIKTNEGLKSINGSFGNTGVWISYVFLIFVSASWLYFIVVKHNITELFGYFIFSAIFHAVNSIIFFENIESITKFLAAELDTHPAQSDVFPLGP